MFIFETECYYEDESCHICGKEFVIGEKCYMDKDSCDQYCLECGKPLYDNFIEGLYNLYKK